MYSLHVSLSLLFIPYSEEGSEGVSLEFINASHQATPMRGYIFSVSIAEYEEYTKNGEKKFIYRAFFLGLRLSWISGCMWQGCKLEGLLE